jgi:hypothetical protein
MRRKKRKAVEAPQEGVEPQGDNAGEPQGDDAGETKLTKQANGIHHGVVRIRVS